MGLESPQVLPSTWGLLGLIGLDIILFLMHLIAPEASNSLWRWLMQNLGFMLSFGMCFMLSVEAVMSDWVSGGRAFFAVMIAVPLGFLLLALLAPEQSHALTRTLLSWVSGIWPGLPT